MRIHLGKNSIRARHGRTICGYTICVAGTLEDTNVEGLENTTAARLESGDTLFTGGIPDQAALLRTLLRLNDLGFTILSVKALRGRRK
ncbi:MAG TPA: hypothetical protein VMT46_12700 [Anaerolineaceae bacterium]|nr:hypothetical protein [Anaerolineaceae bacterium]